jgi:hypothetical protein
MQEFRSPIRPVLAALFPLMTGCGENERDKESMGSVAAAWPEVAFTLRTDVLASLSGEEILRGKFSMIASDHMGHVAAGCIASDISGAIAAHTME